MRARVNRLVSTASLAAAEQREWRRRCCPECLVCAGPTCCTCRLHLLAEGGPADRDQLAGALQDLAERVRVFVKSMTWRGPTPTPAQRASWIEVLGWFAGWDAAARLAETAPGMTRVEQDLDAGPGACRPYLRIFKGNEQSPG